jgi:hypothetical protein
MTLEKQNNNFLKYTTCTSYVLKGTATFLF